MTRPLTLSLCAGTLAAALAASHAYADTRSYCSVLGMRNGSSGPEYSGAYIYTTAADRPDDRIWACKFALSQLLWQYAGEPVRMESGSYDTTGTNKLLLDCADGYQETITGQGSAAFDQAISRANLLKKLCIAKVLP